MNILKSRREFVASLVAMPFFKGISGILPAEVPNANIKDQFQRRPDGISTGLKSFDRVNEGLVPGELMVLAGRPSMGKSLLCNHFARHFALNLGKRVLYVSPESTGFLILSRMSAAEARIPFEEIMSGKMRIETCIKYCRALHHLNKSGIAFLETPAVSSNDVLAEMEKQSPIPFDLVIFDNLGILNSLDETKKSKAEIFEQKLKDLKAMAERFEVPVVASYTLSLATEADGTGLPILRKDPFGKLLRANADKIVQVNRASESLSATEQDRVVAIELPVVSKANGYEGWATVGFNPKTLEVLDLVK